MSSKVTGDAQPDAGTGRGTDQTLPTEIVENLAGAGAGAVTVAESAEPTAESGTAESGTAASEQAPEPTDEPAPGSRPSSWTRPGLRGRGSGRTACGRERGRS